jgi:hypothetical protein
VKSKYVLVFLVFDAALGSVAKTEKLQQIILKDFTGSNAQIGEVFFLYKANFAFFY